VHKSTVAFTGLVPVMEAHCCMYSFSPSYDLVSNSQVSRHFARMLLVIVSKADLVYRSIRRDAHNIAIIDSRRELMFVSEVFYLAAIASVKVSLLFAYRELFYVIIWVNACMWAMIIICTLLFVVNIAGLFTACSPIQRNYSPDIPGTCYFSTTGAVLTSNIINVVIDIILVCIPLFVVWKLRISRIKKFWTSCMLGLGLV